MRWVAFFVLCMLASGCGEDSEKNNRAYVITQTQVNAETPMPEH